MILKKDDFVRNFISFLFDNGLYFDKMNTFWNIKKRIFLQFLKLASFPNPLAILICYIIRYFK